MEEPGWVVKFGLGEEFRTLSGKIKLRQIKDDPFLNLWHAKS